MHCHKKWRIIDISHGTCFSSILVYILHHIVSGFAPPSYLDTRCLLNELDYPLHLVFLSVPFYLWAFSLHF